MYVHESLSLLAIRIMLLITLTYYGVIIFRRYDLRDANVVVVLRVEICALSEV